MKKIIFVIIVAAFVLPMFIKGSDGEPIMSISDWLPEKPDINMLSDSSGSQQSYYRYQDDQGNWQYSDSVPAGVDYEMVDVDTGANLVPGTPLPTAEPVTAVKPAPTAGVAGYMQNLQNSMQDAEDVQNIMDARSSQLDEQIRQSQ